MSTPSNETTKKRPTSSADDHSHSSGFGCFSFILFVALVFFLGALVFGPERAIAAANSTFAYVGSVFFGLFKWFFLALIAVVAAILALVILLGRENPPNRDGGNDPPSDDPSPPGEEGYDGPVNRLFNPDGTPKDFSMN